jgi:hypothetical protein
VAEGEGEGAAVAVAVNTLEIVGSLTVWVVGSSLGNFPPNTEIFFTSSEVVYAWFAINPSLMSEALADNFTRNFTTNV